LTDRVTLATLRAEEIIHRKHVAGGFGFVVLGLLAHGCSSPSGSASPSNAGGGTFAVYGEATAPVTVTGDRIAWPGGFAVERLVVVDAQGDVKWTAYAGAAPFPSPVTYGVLPSGATESARPAGLLASGDVVEIYGAARDPKGYPGRVDGTGVVP
jgi:hypothetical protein